VVVEPVDAPPAGRLAVTADPQGAMFCVWEPGVHKGAQVINEANAWAMSLLQTSDPEAAKAFYGAMFGWETEAFGDQATMWRLPGFVGGEPAQPVPRDLVAVMVPAAPGSAPSWSVNFWVEDADRTAAQTAELGGTVIVEPFDTPISKDAVLADPAGAVFTVSTQPGRQPA
jgi:uncharacterized protein